VLGYFGHMWELYAMLAAVPTLIGVYLGDHEVGRNKKGVVPMNDLVPWLNPAADVVDDALKALGAQRELVPPATLRGVIGIAESYLPLRAFAADVARGAPPAISRGEKPSAIAALSSQSVASAT
jgi:hypothetical protein